LFAIILDNRLPDGKGTALCRQIRSFDHRTPIIFYSAAAYQSDIDQALAAGAQLYLTKPTDLERLSAALQQLLSE
jgi:DNA-binding response OmpR family regulator